MTQTVTPEGAERLRTLYAVMVGVPSEKVSMVGWRVGKVVENHGLVHDCGTLACAVGWACAYPEFEAQGLGWSDFHQPYLEADGRVFYNWEAVTRFFGVDEKTAWHLFDKSDSGLEAKKGVLKRIRTLLWQNGVITNARDLELQALEGGLTE